MTDFSGERAKEIAREAGFELAGVAAAEPTLESAFYPEWLRRGYHGAMGYLEGRRGEMRSDPKTLLKSARSVLCVGQVYNTPYPYSTERDDPGRGWIARYAWGEDYHHTLKNRLYQVVEQLKREAGDFRYKVCVDTSPFLDRAYARQAGLGWIGKNTCLINEQIGSWTLLGAILLSLEMEPDGPPPDRCGTCTRCVDACPTDALVPLDLEGGPSHALDARRCISYWTIEQRGSLAEKDREQVGRHVFGCDICQDVCPWNRPERAAMTEAPEFTAANVEPDLEEMAALGEEEFQARFSDSPLERARHSGFLRNIATAMGNSGESRFVEPLQMLTTHHNETVREHARWAIERLQSPA